MEQGRCQVFVHEKKVDFVHDVCVTSFKNKPVLHRPELNIVVLLVVLLESHELEHIRQHPLTSNAKEFIQACELFGVVVQQLVQHCDLRDTGRLEHGSCASPPAFRQRLLLAAELLNAWSLAN